MVKFREIEYGSTCYRQECLLRNEVLRKPLGLSLWDEDLSGESLQQHYGLFDEEAGLVACGVVQILCENEAKIRQVAVEGSTQRNGVGSQLMREIEQTLSERGIIRVILHSRVSACDFYQKLGYLIGGEEFEEVGLPHRRMSKQLPNTSRKD